MIILTSDRILTVNPKNNNVRFVDEYSDLMGITISLLVGARNLVLHFGTRGDEEWTCDKRSEMVDILVQQYEETTGQKVSVFGVSSAELGVYLTSEKDLARKVSRMPEEHFKLESRSSLYKSQISGVSGDDADSWEEYEELFDDFVILDKDELEQYNAPDKLKKASQEKNSGNSQCLVERPGLNGEKITLEDFEIIKVIDKGSFGKVFLVFNKKMNKLYAMKRINKDVLLEKKQVKNIKNEKEILF